MKAVTRLLVVIFAMPTPAHLNKRNALLCNAFLLDTEELCAELAYSNTLCQQE